MNTNELLSNPQENPAAIKSYKKIEGIISGLEKRSPYSRQNEDDGGITIFESENEESEAFKLCRITDPDSKEVGKLVEFMGSHFKPEELESLKKTQSAIRDKNNSSYYVLKNSKGEIVSISLGSLHSFASEGETGGEKAFFSFDYVATRKDCGGKKLDRELYMESLKSALQNARTRKQELVALLWGAIDRRVEIFASRGTGLEFQTACFEDAEGNFHEVPFNNPPFSWDKNTGLPIDPETKKPAEGNLEKYGVPEILMLRMINEENEITAKELIDMVKAYWEYNCTFKGTAGVIEASEEAIKINRKIVEGFIRTMENQIVQAEGGKIMLLGAREKLELKKRLEAGGKEFIMSEV